MITIMALAERTAARLLRHADARAANGAALRAAGT
jgi:hypothetical protein